METLTLALDNLTAPPVLAFALGALATLARADIRLPPAAYETLSIYLLLAIGIKGGVGLRGADAGAIAAPALAALALGLVVPLVAFRLAGTLTPLPVVDRASLAAHYGSTSLVTFTAAIAFLEREQLPVEGFAAALLALLEVPGIIVGLLLARRAASASTAGAGWGKALHEVLAGRSVVLLVGGLALGLVAGADGYARIEPLFGGLFVGALTLFLLELGAVAAGRLRGVRAAGPGLVVFAIVMPLLAGSAGVLVGDVVGLSTGGAAVLGVLAASASYIAAPAAVRIALPEADPGVSLGASLGITFPFNLVVGIPLCVALAQAL